MHPDLNLGPLKHKIQTFTAQVWHSDPKDVSVCWCTSDNMSYYWNLYSVVILPFFLCSSKGLHHHSHGTYSSLTQTCNDSWFTAMSLYDVCNWKFSYGLKIMVHLKMWFITSRIF